MLQDHPSKLTFSVEESVWLNKGQEIDEILAMSLEPEISIQENQDHVSIRGGLKLTGEYRPQESSQPLEVEEGSLQDQLSFRSIEQVSVSDDGVAKIEHNFPIDVTIPLNRINNLDEIYVLVDSFDYDLPERGCIQLTADVSISGMTNEQPKPPESSREQIVTVESKEKEQEQVPSNIYREPFQFEARKAPGEVEQQQPITLEDTGTEPGSFGGGESQLASEPISQPEIREEPADIAKAEESIGAMSEDVIEKQENGEAEVPATPSIEMNPRKEEKIVSNTAKADAENEEEERDESIEENNIVSINQAEEKTEGAKINLAPLKNLVSNRPFSEPAAIETEAVSESNEEVQEAETKREENALYLTKMLTKGEEQFSKLKMCIIQQNESLDTIAERYEVTASQLVRVNRLDDESVEEGQILYIPVTSR